MSAKLDIWNMAISHLGSSATVASETESSTEATLCRRFYEVCRKTALRNYHWPFAKKFKALALVEEDPTTEWAFSYAMPTDCLHVRRILSGLRNDSVDSRVPFVIVQGTSSLLLYTDMEDAEIEYTAKSDIAALYPEDFSLSLSLLLASMIAPALTSGDPFKLGPRAFQLYQIISGRAVSNALNEQQLEQEPDDSFTRSRS